MDNFIEKITFPDGVYMEIEAYSNTFSAKISTIERKIRTGKLKQRKLHGRKYIKAYSKQDHNNKCDTISFDKNISTLIKKKLVGY